MPDSGSVSREGALTVTPGAVARISELKEMEGNDALMLRVTISGGGCSGFQYGFSLDDRHCDDDVVFAEGSIQVVVDEVSLGLLAGAQVDYVEDLVGSFFSVSNPQRHVELRVRQLVRHLTHRRADQDAPPVRMPRSLTSRSPSR